MSIAVSFIPLVGPLISCVIDGTFVDMWNAIKSGDWAMLGMCAMAFVPGGKALKGLKAVGGLGKTSKVIASYKALSKTAAKEGKQAHHLLEKRLATRLGISDPGSIPAVALTKGEHQAVTNALRKEIAYGTDYTQLSNAQTRQAYGNVYGESSDWFKAIEHYFPVG